MREPPNPVVEQAAPARRAGAGHNALRWMPELALCLLALWGLDALLAPGVPVLEASPSPLWLPVLAFSILYGKGPGLAAALGATVIALTHHNAYAAPNGDFYTLILSASLAPTLWLLAALAIGDIGDRWRQRQQGLETELEQLRVQRSAIADYATVLRSHVETLEFAIAASGEPTAGSVPQCLQALDGEQDDLGALRRAATLILDCGRVSLWWSDGHAWRAQQAGKSASVPVRVLENPALSHGACILPGEHAANDEVGGTVIAAPIRRPLAAAPAGVVVFHSWSRALEPATALALADLIARHVARPDRAATDRNQPDAPATAEAGDWPRPGAPHIRLVGRDR